MKYSIKELLTDKISGEWGDKAINGDGYKVLRTTNFTNLGKINFENIVERKIEKKKVERKHLKQGDIIIEKSGGSPNQPVGRVVYFDLNTDERFLCNNFTAILRPRSDLVNSKYFFYQLYFLHVRGRTLKYQNKTTGIINLKLDNYLAEKIEVPSLSDQLHIANLLTKAENLIAQRKESIALLDDYLKSTFLEMFGDNTANDKGWNRISLVNGCKNNKDVKCGPFGTQLSKSEYQENGIPVWGIPQINSEFKILPKEYLTEKKALELDEYSVIPYDIVMSRKGNVGKCSLFPNGFSKGIIHSDVLRIRTDNRKVHPIFLLFQLKCSKKIEMQIKGVTKGAIMAGINVGLLKHIIIDQPPLELQAQFAQIVEKTEALKAQYLQSLTELENLYGSLSQKAFKGELTLPKAEEQVLMAAEPEGEYGKGTTELTKRDAFLRKLMLASHIVYELCEEPTFGHTKLMKLLYLCEQVGGMALQTNYKKFAAGPFDGKTLTLIDQEYEKNKWFKFEKRGYTVGGIQREATVYKKTEKSLCYKNHFDHYFEQEAESINRLISLFRRERTQTAEVVATLYFAWKELIANKTIVSEPVLIKAFYDFHQEKKKFTKEQIIEGYRFMQKEGVCPK